MIFIIQDKERNKFDNRAVRHLLDNRGKYFRIVRMNLRNIGMAYFNEDDIFQDLIIYLSSKSEYDFESENDINNFIIGCIKHVISRYTSNMFYIIDDKIELADSIGCDEAIQINSSMLWSINMKYRRDVILYCILKVLAFHYGKDFSYQANLLECTVHDMESIRNDVEDILLYISREIEKGTRIRDLLQRLEVHGYSCIADYLEAQGVK